MQKPKGYDSVKPYEPELVDLGEIKKHLVEELTPSSDGFYECPICGSGTHKNKTGALKVYGDGIDKDYWKCHACGNSGDIFDLYRLRDNISASEATRKLIEKYYPGKLTTKAAAAKPKAKTASPSIGFDDDSALAPADPPADFSALIRLCADQMAGSPGEKYLSERGILPETMSRFMLGYNPAKNEITMPYNKACSYYSTRRINPAATIKHWKPDNISPILFNAETLRQDKPVFVVESPLCAISIAQAGGCALALAGLGNIKLLKGELKKIPSPPLLILSLDNDNPGQQAQAKLAEYLSSAGVNFIEFNVAGPCKDPNELLQTDPGALEEMVSAACSVADSYITELKEQAEKKAKEEQAERDKRTGAGMVDSFLQDVQTRMYEPLPTGITDIDNALDGGFIRQQLVCLGAAPGAGKTALAQWIFEGMAAKGISCVFLNLEMSRNQILARSLARCAAVKGMKISSVKLLRGYDWTDEQRETIMAAAEEYKQTVAPQMIYNPDNVTTNLDSILEYLETEAIKAEAAGKPAPCVVLDYLQIVTGKEREDGTELIKRAVASLKGFAVRHNTVVFLIIAHNRESNRSGSITMESGRDTSAIEYSGDTQIGLTFTRCIKGWKDEKGIRHDKAKSPDELTQEERKEITLKIVKSRFGGVGRRVDLRFDGETMTYTQLYKDFEPVEIETPFDDDDPI